MPCLVLTFDFRFNTFNSSQSKCLVRQAKVGESGWLRTGPTDTWLKYYGTAGNQAVNGENKHQPDVLGETGSPRVQRQQINGPCIDP